MRFRFTYFSNTLHLMSRSGLWRVSQSAVGVLNFVSSLDHQSERIRDFGIVSVYRLSGVSDCGICFSEISKISRMPPAFALLGISEFCDPVKHVCCLTIDIATDRSTLVATPVSTITCDTCLDRIVARTHRLPGRMKYPNFSMLQSLMKIH